MNTKLIIFTFAALALSLGSCRNDNEVTPVSNDKVPIKLTSTILETRGGTSLQSDQIEEGIKVGLFVASTDNSTPSKLHYTNQELTANGSGGFTSSEILYYPTDGSKVSIHTYAPYNAEWKKFGEETFTVQSDQSSDKNYLASDLLFAVPTSNEYDKNYTSEIILPHTHKLAKVTLHFDVQDGTDLTGATINILNTLPSITINTQTGVLGTTATGTDTDTTIKAHVASSNSGEDASVILVPQTIDALTPFIEIKTSDSKILQVKLGDSGATFETGKAYTYTVTIKENLVEMNLKSILNNWGDGGSYSVEAKSVSN